MLGDLATNEFVSPATASWPLCLNTSQLVHYRLRIISAGELAGHWGNLEASGDSFVSSLIISRPEGETTQRSGLLSWKGKASLFARFACSLAESDGVRLILTGPDRDRGLRVVNGRRRPYQMRKSHTGNRRYTRNDLPPSEGSSKGNGQGRSSYAPQKWRMPWILDSSSSFGR